MALMVFSQWIRKFENPVTNLKIIADQIIIPSIGMAFGDREHIIIELTSIYERRIIASFEPFQVYLDEPSIERVYCPSDLPIQYKFARVTIWSSFIDTKI